MQATAETQSAFVNECLPLVEEEARRKFRRVPEESRKCDLIAEAVALAWRRWRKEVDSGRNPLDALKRIVRGAVNKSMRGDTLVGGKVTTEPLSWHFCRLVDKPVYSLHQAQDWESDGKYETELNDRRGAEPWQLLVPALDFPQWLETLDRRDRALLRRMGRGATHRQIATRHGVHPSTVSRWLTCLLGDWLAYSSAPDPVQGDDDDNGADTRVDAEPERPVSHAKA